MWFLLTLLIVAAVLQTIALLSLPGRWWRWGLLLAGCVGIFAIHPAAAGMNWQLLQDYINLPETLKLAGTIVQTQSIIALLSGLGLLHRRSTERSVAWYLYFALCPPLLLPVGIIIVLVWLFNTGLQVDFAWTAAGVGILGVLFMGGATELMVWRTRERDRRIELIAIVYLLQIVMAMFLPLLASSPSPIPVEASPATVVSSLWILPLLMAMVGCAATMHWWWSGRQIQKNTKE